MSKSAICPWWLRFALLIPLRNALNKPEKFLELWVKPGMVIADIGCGTGYITLPLARLVGAKGKIIAIDLQSRMLEITRSAADKAGLKNRILFQQAQPETLGALPPLDGAITVWMLHEVPDKDRLIEELYSALKPGSCYLHIEPIIHVSRKLFNAECNLIVKHGFQDEVHPSITLSQSVIYRKK